MGGPGSGRWPRGQPRSAPKYAADRSRQAARARMPLPEDSHVGAAQPTGDSSWHIVVKAWWKSLGLSDTSKVYQEIDWVDAWVCADVLNSMYNYGFQPGLLKEWHAMVEKIHVVRLDLLEASAEEDEPEADEDEQEAVSEISDLKDRLRSA
jgi:hypothetical protein